MKYTKARQIIILIFLVSLLLNLILAFTKKGDIWPESFPKLIITILGVYSVHIAVIFANVFFTKPSKALLNVNLFIMACLISAIWNALLLIRLFQFAIAKEGDDVTFVMNYLNTVSLAGSFMLVGILTYFFAKENKGA